MNRLILAGLGLLLLSLLAPFVAGERRQWTNDMAVQFQEASRNYHAALHSTAHGAERRTAVASALDAAQREFEKHEARLDAARTRGSAIAAVARWLGVALCGVGVAGRLAQRSGLFGKPTVR